MQKTGGLGKGLGALIPETVKEAREAGSPMRLKLSQIVPGRFQPRMGYDEARLRELADSIRESGVLYPLLVRQTPKSGSDGPVYELIAGERRLRAVKMLELSEVPVIVKEVGDAEAARIGLIENVQREGLNAIEEALAYERLRKEFSMTQEEVARSVGKERATVTNTLRLLQLPKVIQDGVIAGKIGMAHGRALLSVNGEKSQRKLYEQVVKRGLSVRQLEALVRKLGQPKARRKGTRDPQLLAAEEALRDYLGTRVLIEHGKKRGWLKMEYYSLEDLDRLMKTIGVKL